MGCGATKDNKDDKEIKYEFERIGLVTLDDFFNRAAGLLESAEGIRSGLDDNKESGYELTGTNTLKDPKYIDVIQVLFWTLSAQNKGKIADTETDIINETPYVKLNRNKCSQEAWEIYETFAGYVKTIMDGPKTIEDVSEQLQGLAERLSSLTTEGKAEIQSSNMSFGDKVKAVANLGKNTSRLTKNIEKCKVLKSTLQQAKTDLQELLPKLRDTLKTADETGAKAVAAKLTRAPEIFDKFHPGARKEGAVIKKNEKKEQVSQGI
jgi:DNA-binding ferritin-like protein